MLNKLSTLTILLLCIFAVVMISGCVSNTSTSFAQVKCEIVCSDEEMSFVGEGTVDRCDIYNYIICHCYKQQTSLIEGSQDDHKFIRVDCVET
jgi:hypothetical protein